MDKRNDELDNSNYSCCWIFNNKHCALCMDLFLAYMGNLCDLWICCKIDKSVF